MPMSYVSMWGMLFVMGLGAGGELISQSDFLGLREAYPSDLAQREALHRCGQGNPEFSRFSMEDRDHCYHVLLHVTGQAAATPRGD